MKITRMIKKEEDIRYLRATMGACYCVNCYYSTDNGKTWNAVFEYPDKDSECIMALTYCLVKKNIGYGESNYWEIIIDLENGKILNWPKGFCLKTHYKVCDDGEYVFLDENMNKIINITKEYDQYYVPDFLSIEDEGYGYYVCINIDGEGKIEHFDKVREKINYYFDSLEE